MKKIIIILLITMSLLFTTSCSKKVRYIDISDFKLYFYYLPSEIDKLNKRFPEFNLSADDFKDPASYYVISLQAGPNETNFEGKMTEIKYQTHTNEGSFRKIINEYFEVSYEKTNQNLGDRTVNVLIKVENPTGAVQPGTTEIDPTFNMWLSNYHLLIKEKNTFNYSSKYYDCNTEDEGVGYNYSNVSLLSLSSCSKKEERIEIFAESFRSVYMLKDYIEHKNYNINIDKYTDEMFKNGLEVFVIPYPAQPYETNIEINFSHIEFETFDEDGNFYPIKHIVFNVTYDKSKEDLGERIIPIIVETNVEDTDPEYPTLEGYDKMVWCYDYVLIKNKR